MKFHRIFSPLSLFLMFYLLLPVKGWTETEKPRPKFSAEQTNHNFGQVFSGEKVVHVFKFSNSGDAPLVIERVRQSCGCTAAVLSSSTLEPGARGEIQSTFDSTSFSGTVVKTIYVYNNDPAFPVVQLHLRGVVQPEIIHKPNRVSLDKMIPEKTVTTRVTLIHQGKNEISFGPVQTTIPELKAELSATRISPGESVSVSLSVTPQTGKRRLGGFMIIPVTGAHMKEIRIPVYASIVPSPASQTLPGSP